jgi:hypothetical protein
MEVAVMEVVGTTTKQQGTGRPRTSNSSRSWRRWARETAKQQQQVAARWARRRRSSSTWWAGGTLGEATARTRRAERRRGAGAPSVGGRGRRPPWSSWPHRRSGSRLRRAAAADGDGTGGLERWSLEAGAWRSRRVGGARARRGLWLRLRVCVRLAAAPLPAGDGDGERATREWLSEGLRG